MFKFDMSYLLYILIIYRYMEEADCLPGTYPLDPRLHLNDLQQRVYNYSLLRDQVNRCIRI